MKSILRLSMGAVCLCFMAGVTNAQTVKQTLDINEMKFPAYSDGNIEEVKAKSADKYLFYLTQLWMAGIDQGGSLCLAANVFKQSGTDFVPGPVSSDPNAYAKYNKVWKINKTMVDSFEQGLYGSSVPAPILDWPAHGDTAFDEKYDLAPFIDVNNDGYYDPIHAGDYPCIPGDQALFLIFNDDTIHTQSTANRLGVEVTAMIYAYHTNNFLDSVVYVRYNVRAVKKALTNFRISTLADFDIGYGLDDLVGTFVDQNAIVAYNSSSTDLSFGQNPPAAGVVALTGMRADIGDGLDNDKDGCIDGIRDANGNCIPENAFPGTREYWRFSSSIYYHNTPNAITGNPANPAEYFNYMRAQWRSGSNLVVESPSGFMMANNGDGYSLDTSLKSTTFAFPGNTFDTSGSFYPNSDLNWFESPNNGGDKRMVMGLGEAANLNIGDTYELRLAYFFAHDTTSLNNYEQAHEMAQKINNHLEITPACQTGLSFGLDEDKPMNGLRVYPNPAQDMVEIIDAANTSKGGYVFSANGQRVQLFEIDETGYARVDLSMLKPGVFIVQVGEKVERLVITQ